MATLEEFLRDLWENPATALATYMLLIDEVSLDFAQGSQTVRGEFDPAREVTVDFDTNNFSVLRAAQDNDPISKRLVVQYLPWKDYGDNKSKKDSGCAKADLNGEGSGIFLTSQLNGCRFTIQYNDGDQKTATVLHLAGTYGESKEGSLQREEVENETLSGRSQALRRRYSFRRYGAMWRQVPGTRTYYDGD